MTNRACERDLTGDTFPHKNVSRVEICMKEVIYEKHMQNAEETKIGEFGVDRCLMIEIVGQGNSMFIGFYQKGGGCEIEIGIGECELIIILFIIYIQ